MNEKLKHKLQRESEMSSGEYIFNSGFTCGFVAAHAGVFAEHVDNLSCYGKSLTIYGLSREQIIAFVQAIPGKYEKKVQEASLCYVNNESPVKIELQTDEPPDSCTWVEEEQVVPAQPETKRLIKKLVCKETNKQESEAQNES